MAFLSPSFVFVYFWGITNINDLWCVDIKNLRRIFHLINYYKICIQNLHQLNCRSQGQKRKNFQNKWSIFNELPTQWIGDCNSKRFLSRKKLSRYQNRRVFDRFPVSVLCCLDDKEGHASFCCYFETLSTNIYKRNPSVRLVVCVGLCRQMCLPKRNACNYLFFFFCIWFYSYRPTMINCPCPNDCDWLEQQILIYIALSDILIHTTPRKNGTMVRFQMGGGRIFSLFRLRDDSTLEFIQWLVVHLSCLLSFERYQTQKRAENNNEKWCVCESHYWW